MNGRLMKMELDGSINNIISKDKAKICKIKKYLY